MTEDFHFREAECCRNCVHREDNNDLWEQSDWNCEFQPNRVILHSNVCDKFEKETI